jgi:hypothetical protein
MSNPDTTASLRFRLEDLAAEIAHARRRRDLGHLAALCYCEVRPWARHAGESRLADLSWALCIQQLPLDRTVFLAQIDCLIEELEQTCTRAGIEQAATSLRMARMA